MTTEIFVVNEDDLVELVLKIMKWKNIHHIPVVNMDNKITGIITNNTFNEIDFKKEDLLVAKDIMVKNIISVTCETSIEKANEIMIRHKIGCLPVLENDELIGILTKNDLDKLQLVPKKDV